jgi:hypothetical protein
MPEVINLRIEGNLFDEDVWVHNPHGQGLIRVKLIAVDSPT